MGIMELTPTFYYVLIAFFLYFATLAYFFLPSPYVEGSKFAKNNQSVAILVLGDIGRSPRMQYHALSLSKLGFTVQLIGYKGSEPQRALLEDTNIKYQTIPDVPDSLKDQPNFLFPVFGPLKVLHQLFFLFIILGYAIDPPAYILVQNPPSIPSLFVVQIISTIRKSRLVIDWHNLGYTVLGLKLGESHPLVGVSRLYERVLGRTAHAHFTVTEAMKAFLVKHFHLKGVVNVLYDRPPAQFQCLTQSQRASFLRSYIETQDFDASKDKLVVSSTSWTEDEDFSILLDALKNYDADQTQSSAKKPRILVIITGKGPMRAHYQKQIDALQMHHVKIKLAWLSAEDYPMLLGCADLGVSLHTSSSGLDLPMKIVDMFGCGLPVLAVQFDALHELVINGLNGRTFNDADDLSQCLLGLFANGQDGQDHLDQLKQGALKEGSKRWNETWTRAAGAIFSKR